jgi:hypothetical protein
MNRGLAFFIARVLSSKNRDLFIVRLGTTLLLAKFGIVGVAGSFAGFFLRGVLGVLIEDGTFLIDISIDAYREGQKLDEFKIHAKEAYEKATAKIYDEAKKQEIREQYLEIISRIGSVGGSSAS